MAATRDAGRPSRRRLWWALWAWAAVALLFLVLAAFARFYDRFPADERIAHAIQGIDVPAFGGFLDFVNLLGDAWLYVTLTLVLSAAFVAVRAGSEALLLVVTFAPRGLNSLIKGFVERPRPSPELIDGPQDASGFGFPSGHTVGTTVLFALLFFLLPVLVPWRPVRWALQGGCLLLVLAAGPARVYVGVHWPSDALGGYLLALLFLAPLVGGYYALRGRFAADSGA